MTLAGAVLANPRSSRQSRRHAARTLARLRWSPTPATCSASAAPVQATQRLASPKSSASLRLPSRERRVTAETVIPRAPAPAHPGANRPRVPPRRRPGTGEGTLAFALSCPPRVELKLRIQKGKSEQARVHLAGPARKLSEAKGNEK